MSMRRKYSPIDPFENSGFTLLEVMVAVAIIAIALVAALGSQSQGVKLATETKFASVGPFLAQSKLAELELVDSEDLSSDSGDFGDDFPGYNWKTEVSDGPPISGPTNSNNSSSTKRENSDDAPSRGLENPDNSSSTSPENIGKHIKKITLIVYRPDIGGYEHRFTYYRYFPETG